MDHYILRPDKTVEPVDLMTWATAFENHSNRVIHQTWVRGRWFRRYWISTVFLGLNHNFNPKGPPLIFETMVWPGGFLWGKRHSSEDFMARYSTYAQAEEGHWTTVRRYRRWRRP